MMIQRIELHPPSLHPHPPQFVAAAAVVITADSVATTDVAVEMTAYGSSYFFSAVADVVTETASANRRQTSMGDLKFP